MIKITYEDKMQYLEEKQKYLQNLYKILKNPNNNDNWQAKKIKKNLDIVECIMEDIRDFKKLIENER